MQSRYVGLVGLVGFFGACQQTAGPIQPEVDAGEGPVRLAGLAENCPNGGVIIDYGIDSMGWRTFRSNERDLWNCHGEDGAPCTSIDHGDGTYTITCPGGDPITVSMETRSPGRTG